MSNTQLLSGFGATKVANAAFAEAGLTKPDGTPLTIPPQMLYNYMRPNDKGKSLIETVVKDGRRFVTAKVLGEWIERYIARKTAPATTEVEEDANA